MFNDELHDWYLDYIELTYEQRLKWLKLPTLSYRRLRGDMIETYKILTGKYNSDVMNNLTEHGLTDQTTRTTRGHDYKLKTESPRLDIQKYSFFSRITNIWNRLPDNIVNAPSKDSFKNKINQFWQNHPILYDPYTSHSWNIKAYELAVEAPSWLD